MIYNNKYYMDKGEAHEKVLTVDDGVSTIATECWIYEDWVDVKDSHGNFAFSQQELTKEIPSDLKQPAVFGLAAVKADGMEISEERLKEYAAYLKRQRKNYWVEYGVKNRPEVAALMADFGLL